MAINYRCILAYGLSDKELEKIEKRRIRLKNVTENDALMKINDILIGSKSEDCYGELPNDEKVIVFNGYNDKELRMTIKFIRSFIKGGVLAVVTEQSNKWTFKYLAEHLIEERKMYESQEKGGN